MPFEHRTGERHLGHDILDLLRFMGEGGMWLLENWGLTQEERAWVREQLSRPPDRRDPDSFPGRMRSLDPEVRGRRIEEGDARVGDRRDPDTHPRMPSPSAQEQMIERGRRRAPRPGSEADGATTTGGTAPDVLQEIHRGRPTELPSAEGLRDRAEEGRARAEGRAGPPTQPEPPNPLDQPLHVDPEFGEVPQRTPDGLALPGQRQMVPAGEADWLYTPRDVQAPRAWGSRDVAALQRKLVKAGLIHDISELGVWDPNSERAYEMLLGMANQQGRSEDDMARMFQQQNQAGRERMMEQLREQDPWVAPEFSIDDATIDSAVRTWFNQQVGRDPYDNELERFGNYLTSQTRRRFDQDQQVARAEWEWGMKQNYDQLFEAERAAGLEYSHEFMDAEHPEEVENRLDEIDPEAAATEKIHEHLAPERHRNVLQEEAPGRQASLFNSLNNMNAAIGRM